MDKVFVQPALPTTDFTPMRFERNDHMITSLLTPRLAMFNFWWINYYSQSPLMSSDNTFPEDVYTITRQYRMIMYARSGFIWGPYFLCLWGEVLSITCSALQILWSACSQQTCDHFPKPWSKKKGSAKHRLNKSLPWVHVPETDINSHKIHTTPCCKPGGTHANCLAYSDCCVLLASSNLRK